MITARELNPHGYILTREQKTNFDKLLAALNAVRESYAKPMVVNSGVRSLQDQMRINPKAPHSAHTHAAAADIADANGDLWAWCLEHLDLLGELGVYLEARAYTPTWVHMQILAPGSRHRIFLP